jgi:Mrp family chromosome partitioning ATPase/capsular polysaccharide biosynthesis protein
LNKEDLKKQLLNKRDSLSILNSGYPQEKKLEQMLEAYGYEVDDLKKDLSVLRFQRTDYINIAYRSENPELSAFVVNTLVTEFHRYFDSFRRERSFESIVSLDSIVKKRKAELDEKIALKTQFQSDSVVMSPELINSSNLQQINLMESNLAEEKGKIQSYAYQIQELNKQIKSISSASQTTPTINPADNDEYMILRKRRSDLYAEYLRTGSNDPAIRKQLDDLDRKMKEKRPSNDLPEKVEIDADKTLRENLIQKKIDAEGGLQTANSKVAYYTSRIRTLREGMGSMASKGAVLEQIDKDIEMLNNEYTSAKDKLNMATNLNDPGTNNFKQTLVGQPAIEPEPSKRIIIMLLAGLSAFVMTCLIFIFLDYIDHSIKTPAQFRRLSGLNILGVINKIPMKGQKLSDNFRQLEDQESGGRNNSFRELLRKLRFEIENSKKRIFLFTSTEPQQGKTTLIQAVAFSISLGKKKVLILDTNFCNNDITVANDAAPRLENFSGNGQIASKAQIADIVSTTSVPNVDIIGCKGGDYTPLEILPKNHLLNYLNDLLNMYDYIFMEGAPLNGYSDSKELVQYAEGVVAIFSAASEIRQADIESINFLKGLKGNFIGAVLNKVETRNLNL